MGYLILDASEQKARTIAMCLIDSAVVNKHATNPTKLKGVSESAFIIECGELWYDHLICLPINHLNIDHRMAIGEDVMFRLVEDSMESYPIGKLLQIDEISNVQHLWDNGRSKSATDCIELDIEYYRTHNVSGVTVVEE